MLTTNFDQQRDAMVTYQLEYRGITDSRVLEALRSVPRERFVPAQYREYSYDDSPLPIGYGVTISQPYIVAKMCEILQIDEHDVILDIGTGSGYQSAILSKLCSKVYSVEVITKLAKQTKQLLKELGYTNIEVVIRDGSKGYDVHAPYDKINCAAATSTVPDAWISQLKDGGIIVFPKVIGSRQVLTEIQKQKTGIKEIYHGGVSFVPLVRKG